MNLEKNVCGSHELSTPAGDEDALWARHGDISFSHGLLLLVRAGKPIQPIFPFKFLPKSSFQVGQAFYLFCQWAWRPQTRSELKYTLPVIKIVTLLKKKKVPRISIFYLNQKRICFYTPNKDLLGKISSSPSQFLDS